jgi:hypothetical protein
MCDIRHENRSRGLTAEYRYRRDTSVGCAWVGRRNSATDGFGQLHNSLAGGKVEQGGIDDVLLRAPPLDPEPPLDPDLLLDPDPPFDP